ncbi:uncharacterized protein B0T15DRAFT_489509 [Chaetomium strumarium]|uniref:Stress-response A/B barrel domain-containing protein n=1 Tax=Chaetomium strumarium TaxID=1170767 RepID=A0AAJ0M6G9_9PEZI|nr:hypothetical protein B0T15DRAFT_489509 [Chaetomium strumarium]
MSTETSPSSVHRRTLFKVPDRDNQQKLIEAYRVLMKDQVKDGKPYILRSVTGIAKDDPRSRNYTVISDMWFANLDDMKYYDTECPAHAALKTAIKEYLAEPPLVICTDGPSGLVG